MVQPPSSTQGLLLQLDSCQAAPPQAANHNTALSGEDLFVAGETKVSPPPPHRQWHEEWDTLAAGRAGPSSFLMEGKGLLLIPLLLQEGKEGGRDWLLLTPSLCLARTPPPFHSRWGEGTSWLLPNWLQPERQLQVGLCRCPRASEMLIPPAQDGLLGHNPPPLGGIHPTWALYGWLR